MSVRDDLIAAKALIDTPEKWGKGLNSFMPSSPDAPLCILGACVKATTDSDVTDYLRKFLPAASGQRSFVSFNDADATTHADIMALFDRAIEAAK